MIESIHTVSVATDESGELGERLAEIGLLEHDGDASVYATGLGALAIVPADNRPGIVRVALTGTSRHLVVDDPNLGTPIEVVGAPAPSQAASPIARIESIPWATHDARAAAAALERELELGAHDRYSGLVFPDVGTTNRLVMVGQSSYLDFNEPISDHAPVRKTLQSVGNSAYAIVLEPHDFDGHVARMQADRIPTVTSAPVELRVRWNDGSSGSAARILAVDRGFLHGLRVFISAPTFPW
jgi:hypothetical protein